MKTHTQLRGLLTILLLLLSIACRQERPAGVPQRAIFIPAGKGGFWQACRFEERQRTDHCQIYNKGGQVLYDETFIPLDEGEVAGAMDLVIAQYDQPPHGGPDRICLKNGRVLIPSSDADRLKGFLARYKGKPCQ